MNSKSIDTAWHKKRLRAEKRFRFYGQFALALAVVILVILLGSIISRGYYGFFQTQVKLPITFDATVLELPLNGDPSELTPYSYARLAQQSLQRLFPEATDMSAQRDLAGLLSSNAGDVIKPVLEQDKALLGQTQDIWIPLSSNADLFFKGRIKESAPETDRPLSDLEIGWLKTLDANGMVRTGFSREFFTQGDSREPAQAGFLGAMLGSAFTLIVCLLVAFPLGVMTAVYLEEFARKSRWVDLIEVNINNLAAVPSIVFGLLGLAVYINVMHLPRSSSIVGGLTLAMMILPVIIIATRASLKSIPDSIRDAARALGASPVQVVWHQILPLAMPGVMTGTILGMARAIGETAPLLMIGMVAFVADPPTGFASPATVMPVQIYLWASSSEMGFSEKTAAGILVLLVLLLAMNALAIILRRRFEVRW
jgi:phosphate transport system permease protein